MVSQQRFLSAGSVPSRPACVILPQFSLNGLRALQLYHDAVRFSSLRRPRPPPPSKIQRRVVDDLFHNEERAGLAHAGQRDQLLAMQSVEVGDIAHADLEEEVEV